MSDPADSVIATQQDKFKFEPTKLFDPVEIVHVFDHASEKFLFLEGLKQRIPSQERRSFILDIIDRVRQTAVAAAEAKNDDEEQSSSSLLVSLLPSRPPLQLSENLYRNFVTVALPEILQFIPPANLARQGIQHFGPTSKRKLRAADGSNDSSVQSGDPDQEQDSFEHQNQQLFLCQKDEHQTCTAKRIFIGGKNGATNLQLLKYHGVTHFVKCCELFPKHSRVDFERDVLEEMMTTTVKQNDDLVFRPAPSIILDVGMKDDDSCEKLSDNFDTVVDWVKERLMSNKKNKVLIFCQAGKHRSAWNAAAVLCHMSRDKQLCCPCLDERTRYHSSLSFSVCHQIVKQARNFTEFTVAAEDKIAKWIEQKRLRVYEDDEEEESEEDKNQTS